MKANLPLWAPLAWHHGWHEGLLLAAGPDGCWHSIDRAATPPPNAAVLPGPAIPGMVNAHSHAFQRAFAGLAEHRTAEHDDFWTWRNRMYRVARNITPDNMRVIARQLYCELLQGGYTHVCEFHYLHHQDVDIPGHDPLAISRALLAAAEDAGIGITLHPAAYERAGFFDNDLLPDQQPFAMTMMQSVAAFYALNHESNERRRFAFAPHSLRAVPLDSLHAFAHTLAETTEPIHIHAAEQVGEVNDCLKATGRRPIELLANEGLLDARWWLVHATHTTPAELDAVADAGSGIVLCPHTEANLGDGVCDLPGMLARGIPIAIGSDSQIVRDWPQELRQLEYAQRLARRQRCIAAQPPKLPSTGECLFAATLHAGARAAGFNHWGFVPGARADLLVINEALPPFAGVPRHALLDALIFSGSGPLFRDVLAAGRWCVRDSKHAAMNTPNFAAAMNQLWTKL